MAKKRGFGWLKGNKPKKAKTGSGNPTFDKLCKAHGLPLPEYEYKFHPWQGGDKDCQVHPTRGDGKCPVCGAWRRLWRFDYLFEGKVAVEMNGGVWTNGRHSGGKGQINDFEKMNEAQILDYIVLQFTPDQFKDGSAFVTIKRALMGEE